MKESLKILGIWLGVASMMFIIMFGIVVILDRVEFQRCIDNEYSTPWYNNNPIKSPYTYFMLSQIKPTYHLSTNSVGDIWIVKETKVGDKTFWTIDYKISVLDLREDQL